MHIDLLAVYMNLYRLFPSSWLQSFTIEENHMLIHGLKSTITVYEISHDYDSPIIHNFPFFS